MNETNEATIDETRRQQIIDSIPSAEDLDLIVIDPPAEWLADKWPDSSVPSPRLPG